MKLKEGRIGEQEGVCILCVVIVLMSVFTLNSRSAYANGNTSYIWLPLGIALAGGASVFSLAMMKRVGEEELSGYYFYGLGGLFGRVALVLIWQAFLLQVSFASALHSYVFQKSQYTSILFWIAAVGFYIAWGGLERIARSAKCISALLGIFLLAAVLAPSKAFSLFRLFPFPGESVAKIGEKTVSASLNALPALLCLQSMKTGMQGLDNMKKISLISVPISLGLVFVVQGALALTYVSTELREMFMPMFRIDMTLLLGDYQLRQDKTTLLLWLMGAMPASAYFEYGAAFLICRIGAIRDIRIPLLVIFIVLSIALPMTYSAYHAFSQAQGWMEAFGWWIVWLPMLVCGLIVPLRLAGRARA